MVDSIGAKPVATADRSVLRIAAAPRVASTVQTPDRSVTAQTTTLGTIAKQLATAAPVDTDRVSKVRKAIAEGKFPILPTTIADRMIALKLDWNGNEASQ